jgi:hypothetical protein
MPLMLSKSHARLHGVANLLHRLYPMGSDGDPSHLEKHVISKNWLDSFERSPIDPLGRVASA